MSKRKLKGKNSKRISTEKKKKMDKTLEKMSKVREKDNIILRDVLQAKLKYVLAEREKGIELVKNLKEKIKITENQILKLEGAIITIQGVFTITKQKEEKPNDKSNN